MDIKDQLEELAFEPVAQLTNELQDIFSVDPVELKKEEGPQDVKQRALKEQWLTLKKETLMKEKKRHDVAFQTEKAKLEMTKEAYKAQIKAIKRVTDAEECQLFLLHKQLEVSQRCHESYLNENKKRAENALFGIQKARDTELALDELSEALIEERKSIERDIERIDGVLSLYTHCKEVLYKVSVVKWQETQTTKQTSGVKDDNSLALFMSAPEYLLDIKTVMTEQNLSLIRNAHKVDETLAELNQAIVNILAKTKEADEKQKVQILDLTKRVDAIKSSTAKLKQRVILYDSIKTANEDIMLDALADQVSKKYTQCMDKWAQCLLTTLEKVANIERRVVTLLDQLESIPDDFVETMLKIKESEKRIRQQEEQLRLERQKQEERVKKCMDRTFKDPPKKLGRKLMPRCIPVDSHAIEEVHVESEEDEQEVFLFGPKNTE
ncbi:hypothetical protein NL108_008112 [Boleophthalmus pectinirostris]|nr:hypothetical protein NL108_008112 [Boleophthalmus pectinirostris]